MNIVEDLINIFYEKQFFKNHQKILNYTKQLYIIIISCRQLKLMFYVEFILIFNSNI